MRFNHFTSALCVAALLVMPQALGAQGRVAPAPAPETAEPPAAAEAAPPPMRGHGPRALLAGPDTTDEEVFEMFHLFRYNSLIRRSVENLPDGIRTVTESDHPAMAALIVSHVAGMAARREEGRDPAVPIQSPTLDVIFANRALIETVLEPTDTGIVVIQTSTDPATVAALQTHAAEVSDMAARGMEVMHERMQALR